VIALRISARTGSMRVGRFLIIALLLAGAPNAARAQSAPSAETLQAAQELFSIMSGDMVKQLTTQVTNAVWPQIEQKARAAKIDDATIAELRSEFERVEVGFLTDSLKQAPSIYARHFTAAELHDLVNFYRSPTGSKALSEMPQVMGEFYATSLVPHMASLQQQINEAMTKVLREHGYAK
jgi:hypothetical protein